MSVLFRIRCCRCGKNIPLAQDIYELDAEWQRRFPDMVGTLACHPCALRTYWSCTDRNGSYVDGHIPAAIPFPVSASRRSVPTLPRLMAVSKETVWFGGGPKFEAAMAFLAEDLGSGEFETVTTEPVQVLGGLRPPRPRSTAWAS